MEVRRIRNEEIDRPDWDKFVEGSPQGSLFCRAGYLDVVAPGWEILEVIAAGRRVGALPFQVKKKGPFFYSLQPAFSPWTGILISNLDTEKPVQQYQSAKRISESILDAIPASLKYLAWGLPPSTTYPLPFHWKGFQLHTRFTYRLNLGDPEDLLGGMDADTKYTLRKTTPWSEGISLSGDPSNLLSLNEANASKGKALLKPHEVRLLPDLIRYLLDSGRGWILESRDESGKPAGAALFGESHGVSHYLFSAIAPEYRSGGPATQLLWRAFSEAKKRGPVFDFEGSMSPGIEGFFRGFGGTLTPYLFVTRNRLPLLLRWTKK